VHNTCNAQLATALLGFKHKTGTRILQTNWIQVGQRGTHIQVVLLRSELSIICRLLGLQRDVTAFRSFTFSRECKGLTQTLGHWHPQTDERRRAQYATPPPPTPPTRSLPGTCPKSNITEKISYSCS
jgi:hypothetical protein